MALPNRGFECMVCDMRYRFAYSGSIGNFLGCPFTKSSLAGLLQILDFDHLILGVGAMLTEPCVSSGGESRTAAPWRGEDAAVSQLSEKRSARRSLAVAAGPMVQSNMYGCTTTMTVTRAVKREGARHNPVELRLIVSNRPSYHIIRAMPWRLGLPWFTGLTTSNMPVFCCGRSCFVLYSGLPRSINQLCKSLGQACSTRAACNTSLSCSHAQKERPTQEFHGAH